MSEKDKKPSVGKTETANFKNKKAAPRKSEDEEIGIRIFVPPNRTVYTVGERFVKNGMRVELVYKSGKCKEIVDFVYSPKGALNLENTHIEVSSCGFTVKQEIFVGEYRGFYDDMYDFSEDPDEECVDDIYFGDPNKVFGIYVCNPPDKKTYFEGECFDPTGLQVMTYMHRGMPGDIVDDFEFSPKEPLTAEVREIEIRYGEFTDCVVITVIPRDCGD